jgi:hypothetical protein
LGLLSLTKKHPSESLEKACEIGLSHGAFRLRTIRQLLKRADFKQEPLPFLEEHPIIRPLDDYAQVVAAALERKGPAGYPERAPGPEGFGRHDSSVQWPPEKAGSPGAVGDQGFGASLTRPRSGYPLPGCSSAAPVSTAAVETTGVDKVAPDSVLPDSSILRSSPSQQQEPETDE